VTAIIVTVAKDPPRAWVSTDGLATPDDGAPPFLMGPKWRVAPDGVLVTGCGDLGLMCLFASWCDDVLGDQRLRMAPRWLRNAAPAATVFLVEPGRGWALSFEDGYEPHPLALGIPAARPALPRPVAATGAGRRSVGVARALLAGSRAGLRGWQHQAVARRRHRRRLRLDVHPHASWR
jgi:hypothetical protein